jgi:selenocysteine-specific elongation factor
MNAAAAQPPDDRRFVVLCTAGHIDHGKSALVKALTGTDPDRLPEEKARGMTIELGFARLDLPGVTVGIVDVPGHERFVRTMVAGATGVDLAMLVVAADDGVMPQTREHVDVLDLLGVTTGLAVINKSDLADDGRLAQVATDVRELLSTTGLKDAPILPASATAGSGLDAVRDELARLVAGMDRRSDSAVFRLAVDRVFSLPGRGTIVTGSVLRGQVRRQTDLELLPAKRTCRVREIQSHNVAAESIGAGRRCAINLAGIHREQITRGDELATPDCLQPTDYLDGRVRVVSRWDKPIDTHTRVRLCMGTGETSATLVWLDAEQVSPGQAGYAQLRTSRPVVAAHGQHFILREQTDQTTLGGGVVLRCVSRRLTPKQIEDVAGLEDLASDDAQHRLGETLRALGFHRCGELQLAIRSGLEPDQIEPTTARLAEANVLLTLPGVDRPVHRQVIAALRKRTERLLRWHHAANPKSAGLDQASLRNWLSRRSDGSVAKVLMEQWLAERWLLAQGGLVGLAECQPQLSAKDQQLAERILAELDQAGFQPPQMEQLTATRGMPPARLKPLVALLAARGEVVRVAEGIHLYAKRADELKRTVAQIIRAEGQLTVATLRNRLGSSRKYVVPYLEYLDRIGFTRRVGDARVLRESDEKA